MKHSITHLLAVGALGLLACATHLSAQTSAFTYQGALTQNGQPANGAYDFMFRLMNAPTDGAAAPVIPVNPGVVVTNGLFTTGIDFGAENLNGANLWLEINVRTNGSGAFTTLGPRQLLTSAPYAVRAANAATVEMGEIRNPTFVGTTSNQPFDISVNGQRALRLEDNGDGGDSGNLSDGAPNIVAGSAGNHVAPGVVGATISGGGATNWLGIARTNSLLADYSTVGGGLALRVAPGALASVISGGFQNDIGTNSSYSTIGGGRDNHIFSDSYFSTIGGGTANSVGDNAPYSTIIGGYQNYIDAGSRYALVGGGQGNSIRLDSQYSAIGSGQNNYIGDNSSHTLLLGGLANAITRAQFGIIGGGQQNRISDDSFYVFLGGGYLNYVRTNSSHSAIVGGRENGIGPNTEYSSILGGRHCDIGQGSIYSVISGGYLTKIRADSAYSTITGGAGNEIRSGSQAGIIGGGIDNRIGEGSFEVTIGGGRDNSVGTNATHATISGGTGNRVADNALFGTIPGGALNQATNYAFAAGYRAKSINTGSFVWGDSTEGDVVSSADNQFTVRAAGGVRLFSAANLSAGVSLAPNATAWSVLSDQAVKKDFAAVDSREVLEKLAAVPVQSWHYQWESADATPHLGPVAQDFKAAFYPGRDDKSITTLEFDGVALAAIQGLNQKLEDQLEQKQTEITELQRQNAELLKRLEAIEARLP